MSYGNCHSLVGKLPDVSFPFKHMTDDWIFPEKLGQCGVKNDNVPSVFANLILDEIACLLIRLPQFKYIYKLHKN